MVNRFRALRNLGGGAREGPIIALRQRYECRSNVEVPNAVRGEFDPHDGQKDNYAQRNEQPESELSKKRESGMREEFFISSDNVVTAASPPYQLVTRSSLLVRRTLIANSPQMLRSARTPTIKKKTPKTPNILGDLFSKRLQDKPLVTPNRGDPTKKSRGPVARRLPLW